MVQAYTVGEPILRCQGVSLSFGDRPILSDINLVVCDIHRPAPITQGQVIGFLGPSGRGKTMLSKILAGLLQPSAGVVLVNNPSVPVQAGMVGYVTQNYLLRRNRTLIGNLRLAAHMHNTPPEKIDEYVDLFELRAFLNHYPTQLSGGQRQRVAIAQQLLCSDHYLIMDEPFSGLDPVMKQKVCDLIVKVSLMDELNTIIIVSHDIRAVLSVSETIWLLGKTSDAGSRIQAQYDLMERGLCWEPDAKRSPEFASLLSEIEGRFLDL